MVLISSVAAHVGMLHLSHYSAAKAGVVGLMRALAVELAPHMIRVNTIHPTSVNTAMIVNEATYDLLVPGAGPAARHGAEKVPAEVAEGFKGINAMPIAWAEPEDISAAVIFLCPTAADTSPVPSSASTRGRPPSRPLPVTIRVSRPERQRSLHAGGEPAKSYSG